MPIFMFIECVIHLIQPYPFFNAVSDGGSNSKYLELLMFFRMYTFLRVIHHWSPLYRFRHDIVAQTTELHKSNFEVTFADTIKVLCYQHTVLVGLLLYFTVIVAGGYSVFVAERDSNNGCDPVGNFPGDDGLGFNSTWDGVYFMMISVRTIGFGDLRPVTVVGRLLTIMFQFTGMAVEAFLGGVIVNKIAPSRIEKLIREHLDSLFAWHEFRISAAMLIQATWKSSLLYEYLRGNVPEAYFRKKLRLLEGKPPREAGDRPSQFPLPSYDDLRSQQKSLVQEKFVRPTQSKEFDLVEQVVGYEEFESYYRRFHGWSRLTLENHRTLEKSIYDATRHEDEQHTRSVFDRIWYFKSRKTTTGADADLVRALEQNQRLFNLDDIVRFGRKVNVVPKQVKQFRTFSSTKLVVGPLGPRRIPSGVGHKADIKLEAIKSYCAAKSQYRRSLLSTNDAAVDDKLLLVYRTLTACVLLLKRNQITFKGLRKVVDLEFTALERLLRLALSGGDPN